MKLNKKSFTVAIVLCVLNIGVFAAAPVKEAGPGEINQRLDRMEQLLNNQGLLDMLQKVEQLQQQLNHLRGEIEVQNHTLEQLKNRQRDLYTDIDQRLQRIEGGTVTGATDTSHSESTETQPGDGAPPLETLSPVTAGPDMATTPSSEGPLTVEVINSTPVEQPAEAVTQPADATASTTADTADDEEINIQPAAAERVEDTTDPIQLEAEYQQAFKLLKQSLYDQAIKAFQTFLAAHPNSDYSDNAQYWLAEAFYVTRQFESALVEYTNLVTNYPKSQKLTHALLKMGYTQQELGNIDTAKKTLQDLIQKYPGTTAARLAEERLIKINAAAQTPASSG